MSPCIKEHPELYTGSYCHKCNKVVTFFDTCQLKRRADMENRPPLDAADAENCQTLTKQQIEQKAKETAKNEMLHKILERTPRLKYLCRSTKLNIKDAMHEYGEWMQGEGERQWISVKDRLPELDPADKWCLGSKRVLTSSDMGIRFGQYFQNGDFWRVEGVTSSEGIPVTHWMLIEPPKPQTEQP